jgi:hypothetical protein
MAEAFGTMIGIGWAVCGIAGWLMMGGGLALGSWRGALILGPIALLIAIINERR